MILTLIVQSMISMYFPLYGMVPDLMLVSVVYFSLRKGTVFGEAYGFFSGILLDVFSLQVFGARAVIFTVIGYLVGRYSHKLDETKVRVQVIICFMSMLFYLLVFNLICAVFLPRSNVFHIYALLTEVIYTSVFVPLVFGLLNIWFRKTRKWSGKANRI